MRFFTLFALFIALFIQAKAQSVKVTLRTGLNFSNWNTTPETNASGATLETFDRLIGFHFAAGATFFPIKELGFRGELQFNQHGTKYRYNGDAQQIFPLTGGQFYENPGNRKIILNISTSHLELPINVVYKPISRLEIFGGGYVGLVVGAQGDGEWIYTGESKSKEAIAITVPMTQKYFKDKAFDPTTIANDASAIQFRADGKTVRVPSSLGAYYDVTSGSDKYLKRLDLGVQGGLSWFFTQGLFLRLTYAYGLSDITNNAYDVNRQQVTGNTYAPRPISVRNVQYQASLGLSF